MGGISGFRDSPFRLSLASHGVHSIPGDSPLRPSVASHGIHSIPGDSPLRPSVASHGIHSIPGDKKTPVTSCCDRGCRLAWLVRSVISSLIVLPCTNSSLFILDFGDGYSVSGVKGVVCRLSDETVVGIFLQIQPKQFLMTISH